MPNPTGALYGSGPQNPTGYGGGVPAQPQRPVLRCQVCGHTIDYGARSCSVCTVPVGMIANPFDPTVTTYLDARALHQPGTSPVYAAPGSYAGRAADSSNGVPEEVRRGWNWAAALNSTLWAFTHRAVGWGLLCAAGLFCWVAVIVAISATPSADLHSTDSTATDVTIVLIGGSTLFWLFKTLYLGVKGNTIAWHSGRYSNASQMRNVQGQWVSWSLLMFFTVTILLVTATVIAVRR